MSKGTWLGIIIGSAYAFSASCAHAQITPDNSLPNNSNVTINGRVFNITGGTQAGHNLFHSFQQFSVPIRGTASFNNGLDIQNIFSRVTGESASNINGLIQASGTANLFFLNPNGIVFGKNARLNIGGSFVATTANAIQFGNIGTFSATNPEAPTPVLTINPTALLFNQIAAPIQNNSVAPAGADSAGFDTSGLRVPDGQSLLLVGGNINLNGGSLNALGGRVELGGLAAPGAVGLQVNNKDLTLSFPNNIPRADVSLDNGAIVRVNSGGGGNIVINARNLDLTGGSTLVAGIEQGLGSIGAQAGDITLNATGDINVVEGSFIFNDVDEMTIGNGGNIIINAQQLILRDGVGVSTATFGTGKGGNLTVNADSVQLFGTSAESDQISVLSTGQYTLGANGNAGDLTINTQKLLIQNGAEIVTGTYGAGNGGNLTVKADNVQLIGTSTDGKAPSGLFTSNQQGATGNAGNLTISTQKLLLRDGAAIASDTFGTGNGGILTVNATDSVQLIDAQLRVAANEDATGYAGNLTINTPQLLLTDRAQVNAATFGAGKGGNLTVNANSVQLIGVYSGLFADNQQGAIGDAGNLIINTQQLLIKDGAQVSTSTYGTGKGGNLTVNANSVQLIGSFADGQFPSGLFAQALSTGDAGNLTINTQLLLVEDKAQAGASTYGAGKGGNLIVNANSVQLTGISADGQFSSGLFAQANSGSTGDAGSLTINTHDLFVRSGAGVFVRSLGTGTAGNLTVNARSIRLDNGNLSANTPSNNTNPNLEQATITIHSGDLILRRDSNITTNATGSNVIGGNINIDTDVLAALENSHISANSTDFRGGKVRINTSGIFLSPESTITATGASPLFNGIVQINTSDINPAQGLLQLSTNLINPNTLIANSCIARTRKQQGTFNITGTGGLPSHPGDAFISSYPTGTVRNVQGTNSTSTWHKGNPIMEPQGVYQLPNGHLVLSRECS